MKINYSLHTRDEKVTVYSDPGPAQPLTLTEEEACRQLLAFPELLAACRAVLDRHNYQCTGEPWSSLFDHVRAAIAKAEGR